MYPKLQILSLEKVGSWRLIKSNVLNDSTLGATKRRSGRVETLGLIKYVCQTPEWIKADSLAALITGEKCIYEAGGV